LNPATGRPTDARWRLVGVTGPGAALADALSTAFCVMEDRAAMERALAAFPGMAPMPRRPRCPSSAAARRRSRRGCCGR
ncbi:MAG: FAD:protein FMN transferase, partial [Roseovarius sp.]|nr:FAD:protein FMN transferase [Roseovarius sp.]